MWSFFGQFLPNYFEKKEERGAEKEKEISAASKAPERSQPQKVDEKKSNASTVLSKEEQVKTTDDAFHCALEAMEQLTELVGDAAARRLLMQKIASENNEKLAELYWQDQNTLVLLAENVGIGVTADMSATPFQASNETTKNLITKLFAIFFGIKGFWKIMDNCTEEKILLVSADEKFFEGRVNLVGEIRDIKKVYTSVLQLNRNQKPEFETFFRNRFLIARLTLQNRCVVAEMIVPKHYRVKDAQNRLCAAVYLHLVKNNEYFR